MLILWVIVFAVSLAVLVKGADWLITSAEKMGLAAGLSPFIVGVTIVGVGTSFPELITAFAAVIKGVPDVVAANAVGSNVANILLIVGVSAVLGRRLMVTKSPMTSICRSWPSGRFCFWESSATGMLLSASGY